MTEPPEPSRDSAKQYDRRSLLRGILGIGLAAPVTTLLAACSDDTPADDSTQEPTEPEETESATPAPTGDDTGNETTPESDDQDSGSEETEEPETDEDPSPDETEQGDPGHLRFGLSGYPVSLDPHVGTNLPSRTVKLQLYNRLTRYSLSDVLEIEGDLATIWEISDDGLEYLFYLREGVQFHNGDAFTSQDVVATLERILDEGSSATLRIELNVIEDVVAQDDYRVRIMLNQLNPALLDYLCLPEVSILSSDWLADGQDPESAVNGTGPFQLVEYDPESIVQVERFPDYFRNGLPRLNSIEFRPIADPAERAVAFYDQLIDIIEAAPHSEMATLDALDEIDLVLSDESAFLCLMYNVRRPPFDDPEFRRAINFAYDRQGIIDAVFFGQGSVMGGGIIPSSSWAYNPSLQGTYTYDPDLARELLAEAGYEEGIQITLLATADYSTHENTAEIVQRNLEDVGIECEIDYQDPSTVVQRHTQGEYEFRLHELATDIIDPAFINLYFNSEAAFGGQSTGFVDEEIDELLEAGMSTTDRSERIGIYHEIEERILELVPWAFLAWRAQGAAVHAGINGYRRLPSGLGAMSGVTLHQVWKDGGAEPG